MAKQHIIDLLSGDQFSCGTMVEAVSRKNKLWRKIKQLGIFKKIPIDTSTVEIDVQNDEIVVLPQTNRGGAATFEKPSSENAVILKVPNFKRKAILTASDLQNVRDAGTTSLKTLQSKVAKKVTDIDNKIEMTHEFLMMGALRGQVVGIDGKVICDLFKKFDKQQQTVEFPFSSATGDVIGAANSVSDMIMERLDDDVSTGILVLCSAGFWNKMMNNQKIFSIYKNRHNEPNPLINDLKDGFEWEGLTFVKYVGSVKNAAGETVPFVPADEAIALPLGTQNTFEMYMSPADLLDYVNQEGMEKYFTTSYETKDGEDQVVVRGETNPLPVCKKPDVLIRLTVR